MSNGNCDWIVVCFGQCPHVKVNTSAVAHLFRVRVRWPIRFGDEEFCPILSESEPGQLILPWGHHRVVEPWLADDVPKPFH